MNAVKEFKVGQHWQTRDGRIVEITSIDNDPGYPINSDNGSHTLEGEVWRNEANGGDLIKLISEPSTILGQLSSQPLQTRTFRQDLVLAALRSQVGTAPPTEVARRVSAIVDQLDAKYGDAVVGA